MRLEQSRPHTAAPGQEEEEEEVEDAGRMFGKAKSGLDADVSGANPAQGMSRAPAVPLSSDGLRCGSWKRLSCSEPPPPPDGWASPGQASANGLRLGPVAGGHSATTETFNSSFSFIQQSLNSCRTAATPASPEPEPLTQLNKAPQSKRPVHLLSFADPADGEDLPSGESFWQKCPWDGRGVPPGPADCDCVDIEVTSSLSVDSDNASASSVTSGYESATPASDQGWDSLMKKYEVVLQDCLQNNRTYTKVGHQRR